MRYQLLTSVFIALIVLTAASIFSGVPGAKHAQLHAGSNDDWQPVERALGRNGTMLSGDVFMISLPRTDLNVTLGGIPLKPAFALDSWVAFKNMGNGSMMMGDLVLADPEMGPVQKTVRENSIGISAIHNTLIGEYPKTYDLHISGYGDPVKMAETIHDALMLTKMRYDAVGDHSINTSLDQTQLDSIMGRAGSWDGGIYHYDIPRANKITESGMEIPPTMDVSTALKFQPLDSNRAAITGDFILTGDEVNPVINALNDHDIDVVALHSHMLNEEPRMFFLHFWAAGDAARLARGLRAALDQTDSA